MSTPIKADDRAPLEALQSALGEILSAESSLNMHPEPVDLEPEVQKSKIWAGEISGYLSETDANAAHAMEHLHAAFALVAKAQLEQEALKHQVFRLVEQLRAVGLRPKVKTWLDEPEATQS